MLATCIEWVKKELRGRFGASLLWGALGREWGSCREMLKEKLVRTVPNASMSDKAMLRQLSEA
jgi:hypothetical protein